MENSTINVTGQPQLNKKPKKKPKKISKVAINHENIHPLEVKYGKEPKIDPVDRWRWH
ncbi:MAG: hypothetical protein ACXAC8_09855 [Candidatus Hodarchaeales archaeon]